MEHLSNIKIIPLGGARENGKNMYVIEVDDTIFILDCGLSYPEEELFGIDSVIPDFTYLLENQEKIAGVFLSHGHEDSIGGLPYFLQSFDVPVFGSKLTIELAKLFVKEAKVDADFSQFHIINEDMEIAFNNEVIRFFRVTHSIPDSMGIAVKTDEGNIIYTGNFKFDQTAQGDYATDYRKIVDLGNESVLALLSDSSEASALEENDSDVNAQKEITMTFQEAQGRIIVIAVASNILRIQQVINAAARTGRKIFLTGKRIESILDIAIQSGKLNLPEDDLIITKKDLNRYQDNELVILETGTSGEPMQSLRKMATGHHTQIKIHKNDLAYLVTTPSASMEVYAADTKNLVYRAGGQVKSISDKIKNSGHGTPKDLQLMINLLKPKYFIPIQGSYALLVAHANLAHLTGMTYDNIFIISNGDVLEYSKGKMRHQGQVPASNTLIDGMGVGDVGNVVLRDRRLLSEDGILVAVITIDCKKHTIVAGPHIVTRGFVFVKESKDLIADANDIVTQVVKRNLKKKDFEWNELKSELREDLNKYLFKQTGRRPIILPVVMEVNQKRWYDYQ